MPCLQAGEAQRQLAVGEPTFFTLAQPGMPFFRKPMQATRSATESSRCNKPRPSLLLRFPDTLPSIRLAFPERRLKSSWEILRPAALTEEFPVEISTSTAAGQLHQV